MREGKACADDGVNRRSGADGCCPNPATLARRATAARRRRRLQQQPTRSSSTPFKREGGRKRKKEGNSTPRGCKDPEGNPFGLY